MSQRSIYLAHPINTYDTDLERALIQRIAERFPGYRIVNPGHPEHQAKYEAYMARGANEMDYFIELALGCDECVLLAFRDQMIGAGVYKEATEMHRQALAVWEITPDGTFFTWAPNPMRELSVPETIARIRDAAKRPLPF